MKETTIGSVSMTPNPVSAGAAMLVSVEAVQRSLTWQDISTLTWGDLSSRTWD